MPYDLLAENSWFFRNALVRANYENPLAGISRDLEPLERFFRNLILGEKNELKNRYLLVGLKPSEKAQLDANPQSGQKTVDRLVSLLKAHTHLTQEGMVAALMIAEHRSEAYFQLEEGGTPPPCRPRQGRSLGGHRMKSESKCPRRRALRYGGQIAFTKLDVADSLRIRKSASTAANMVVPPKLWDEAPHGNTANMAVGGSCGDDEVGVKEK